MKRTYTGWRAASAKGGWRSWAGVWLLLLAVMAGVSGCLTAKDSTPVRTATEELLLSTAMDSALENARFPWLDGKRVFVEEKYFDGYDKGYALGLLRQRISASGALLVKTDDKADVVVEVRSGALSMDTSQMLVGLPAMTLPVPLTGMVPTPQLGIYVKDSFDSVAKFALFAYEQPSGRYLQSAGPMEAKAYLHRYRFLFVTWRRSDVPELADHPKPKFSEVEPPSAQSP
ncbi:MAG: DUF6655 family protein [Limisphaerales bacterium]